MYRVEMHARVRRACRVEGMSTREASRVFGLDRKTVRKMLSFSVPPGYRRGKPPRRPKLGPFTGIIDRILEDDRTSHHKQRHTAKRIFDRLRDEYGFTGGYTIVKDYVRERRLRSREMFVPLVHSPGHAQADFGEAMAVIGGVARKVHFLAFDLPHSDACFVKAYPAETTEAFCDGHNAAVAFFGGVPRSILYDNTKLAVARILGDGKQQRTRVFTELQSGLAPVWWRACCSRPASHLELDRALVAERREPPDRIVEPVDVPSHRVLGPGSGSARRPARSART